MSRYPLHPLVEAFPEMDAPAFAAFMDDVRSYGIREPITLWRGQVIDGRHRLRASQALGIECPTREWHGEEAALVGYVVSLNLQRRHLSESQRSMVAADISNLGHGQKKADMPIGISADEAAGMLNVGVRSVLRAREVRRTGAPELIQAVRQGHVAVSAAAILTELPAETQRAVVAGGEVAIKRAVRQVKEDRDASRHEAYVDDGPVIPSAETCSTDDFAALAATGQKFGTVYADPPWLYGNQATRAATSNHYDGMSVADLCALPVREMIADRAHCHLWTTSGFLRDAFTVLDAWGFTYKSSFVWVKPQMGIGNYWRLSHEFLLLGVRGGLTFRDRGLRSWIESPRGQHSAKPEAVRGFIERGSPGPYLEMFGRRTAPGWTTWGNQIARTLFDHATQVA